MEIEGIKVDDKFLQTLSDKFEKKISKLEKEIFKISKKIFNIASPKQLGEIIYNDLKIAVLKKTKKGRPCRPKNKDFSIYLLAIRFLKN